MHPIMKPALAASLSLLLAASPALAETLQFEAELSADNAVPPVESSATGTMEGSYDTESKSFSWTITYDGLSGPATAAHFHGPAEEDENAPPVVPITGELPPGEEVEAALKLPSPLGGRAILTDEQAQQLQDGLWYVNIHTEKYPGGELRGQVLQEDTMGADGAMDSDADEGADTESLTEDNSEDSDG